MCAWLVKNRHLSMTSPTLVLPPGVVQPFDLHRLHDDLHVMAFFDGHPAYEAVEAMIRRSADGPAAIRAILTRHDQTQIDHVNDDGLCAAARFAPRPTFRREIAFVEDRTEACPRCGWPSSRTPARRWCSTSPAPRHPMRRAAASAIRVDTPKGAACR